MQIYFVHKSLSQSVEVRYEVNKTKDQEFHCVLIIIIKLESNKNNIKNVWVLIRENGRKEMSKALVGGDILLVRN